MTHNDELVERLARASMAAADAEYDGMVLPWSDVPEEEKAIARIRTRAVLSELSAAGMVVVPREPTEAMMAAAHDAGDRHLIGGARELESAEIALLWTAMLNAHKEG